MTDSISNLPSHSPENGAAIPDKLYFKIGEVAKLVGVETYVLRFWETEFPQISPVKSKTGQRLYKRHHVETIFEIRGLLYDQKFTIDGAKRRLKEIHRESRQDDDALQMPLDLGADEPARPADQVKDEIRDILSEMENFLKR